jgi:hypothetical protein
MLTAGGRVVNRLGESLNDPGDVPTAAQEMTVLADSPAGRPDVAVVRKPISDERDGRGL